MYYLIEIQFYLILSPSFPPTCLCVAMCYSQVHAKGAIIKQLKDIFLMSQFVSVSILIIANGLKGLLSLKYITIS